MNRARHPYEVEPKVAYALEPGRLKSFVER